MRQIRLVTLLMFCRKQILLFFFLVHCYKMCPVVKKSIPYDGDSEFGSLDQNLARVLVWRKQEDNFLSEHTPFPGEEVGALKKNVLC